MPDSASLAAQFMNEGRGGSESTSVSAEVPCPVVDMARPNGFDAAGSAKSGVIPDGVCYNPYSEDMRAPDWYKKQIMDNIKDGDADDAKK